MRNFPSRHLAYDASRSIVCRSCRLQRRQFASSSTTPTATSAPPAPPAAGITALASRRVISVAGPDAAKFLQGIITGNINGPDGKTRSDGFYSGFLTATGRILYDVMIYPNPKIPGGAQHEGDGFLIEVDAGQAETLARHIKRYKLRAKLAVRLLAQDEATVWHAWDETSATSWGSAAARASVSLRDRRTTDLGYRFVQFGQSAPEIDLETSTEDAYTIRRYLRGVAEGQDEITREHALPSESNMDFLNGIDWRKGCYVGQELTIRTKHRGVVRKRILPCVIYEKEHAMPQTLQYHASTASLESPTADMIPRDTSIGRFEKRGRSAGKWLKGIGNVGLGLCRLEIMTDVVLPGETAAATFNPDDEFIMDWGEEGDKSSVKVKAFVPEWLRAGLNASQQH